MAIAHEEGFFESTQGVRLHGQAWRPPGEPRSVVGIVHGVGEHGGRFTNVVEALVSRGHAVHAIDLRGYGRSSGQRGHVMSWSEYQDDMRAFLKQLSTREPGKPVFLYGHSMGGLVVLDYVLRHPEGLAGIIISGAALESVGVAKPWLVNSARLFSRLVPRLPLPVPLEAEALSSDPAWVKRYREDPLVHRKGTARWAVEAIDANEWIKAHAAELRVPMLMLHGAEDRINTVEGSRRFFDAVKLTDKKLHLVPGGYHEPHNDPGKEQVFELVEEFLSAHLPR
ncbi:lysophospholipase [Cystobacter fuscus]|uniref:alpha/beta hydrolase n=1 Tax=Cystobacter fuscus TaxID=43 RepID=UPI002B3010E8|nr:lysophospholipase [Cystobacter fuscus]